MKLLHKLHTCLLHISYTLLQTLFTVLKKICTDVLSNCVKKHFSFLQDYIGYLFLLKLILYGTKEDSLAKKHLHVDRKTKTLKLTDRNVYISERRGGQSNIF